MADGATGTRAPSARLRVFGSVVFEFGDEQITPSPAAALLVGYLAVHGRTKRDTVAFTLWPDRPDDRARRTLSDAVYRLRAQLGADRDVLTVDGDWLTLADTVTVDLTEFLTAADAGDTALGAAALAGEPLLVSVDADWADAARARVHRRLATTLARLWGDLDAAARHDAALTAAERWSAVEPFDEAAHRAVMCSLSRLGRAAGALRYYDQLVELLASELAVDPAAETAELAEQLRGEALAQRDPARAPLVGRVAERARLVALVESAVAGAGGLAVVLGEPGIGKSRLLDEVVAAAKWRGVATGRAAADVGHASVLLDGLVDLVPDARLDQLTDLGDPVWIGTFRTATGGRSVSGAALRPAERAAMAREVISAVGRLGPHVLVLDDMHWADDESWELLDELRGALATVPVAVVVAARRDDVRSDSGRWRRVEDWDRAGATVVSLGPLPDDAISELLSAAGTQPGALAPVAARAGGNPFVALCLSTGDAEDAASDVWQERIARLDADARDIARLAAVLGLHFDYRHLRGDEPARSARALATLEHHGIVEVGPDGHRFTHDLWRTAVLDPLTDIERVDLHATAFDRLRSTGDAPAAVLLHHAEACGRLDAARALATRAGQAALVHGDAVAAAAYFGRALDLLDAGDAGENERFAALAGRVAATSVLAEPGAHAAAVDAMVACGMQLGGWSYVESQRQAALRALHLGRFAEALTIADAMRSAATAASGAALVQGTEPRVTAARLDAVAASALRELGAIGDATERCLAALDAFAAIGADDGVAEMTDLAGGLAWRRGDYAEAAELHGRAAAAFANLGLPLQRARALNNLGTAQWSRGDYRAAEVSHTAALDLCRALGDRRSEGDNTDNLGGVAWALGDDETAAARYTEALAVRRATDDPWGVSISLSNLGDVYRAVGEPDRALALYDESLAVNAEAGVVRNDATTRMGRGLALLEAARTAAAIAELGAAAELLGDLGDRTNLAETTAGLVFAHLRAGDRHAATELGARLEELVRPDDRAELRQLAALAAGELTPGDRHAAAAWAAMHEALAVADPAHRPGIAARRVLHRRTRELFTRHARFHTVTLASGDTVEVTARAPDDPPGRDGRLAAIRRITAEAVKAGSTAGDEALAAALGVTRRTILRDIDSLRAGGVTVITTGRA